MKALVWLKGARDMLVICGVNEEIPVLRRAESSGGSRAANGDGAPRKHGAFHSSRAVTSQRAGKPSFSGGLPRPGRVSRHHHARADVAGDHAAGADQGTVTDGDPGQDDGAAADPDIAADPDRAPEFEALAPCFGVARMIGGVDLHRRPALGAVADRDFDDVENDAVEVEKHALSEPDVVTV